MEKENFNSLIHTTADLSMVQVDELAAIIEKYPYFQVARAVQLKGLYQNQSLSYNAALKKTAAYTTDRSVLFEYITSEEFKQHHVSKQILKRNRAQAKEEEQEEDFEQAIRMERSEADRVLDPDLFEERMAERKMTADDSQLDEVTETVPEEGEEQEPIVSFDKNQEHSFSDWLKLMAAKPIKREENSQKQRSKDTRKEQIIDRFIEESPKIVPSEKISGQIFIRDYEPDSHLMTETLAKIYADQKNYDKAIQAYKILMLKNPEKSGFFADRIREIEINKENKNK